MDLYLCPPKVDLRGFSVTKGVIPLQMQYNGSYCLSRVLSGSKPNFFESDYEQPLQAYIPLDYVYEWGLHTILQQQS
jgi:hypothetical protein